MWISRYELVPRTRLNALAPAAGPRRGALLRMGNGFADIHPWPELGDLPIDGQLAMLARGEETALTAASVRFAQLDGAARLEGRSLFERLTIPESHWPAGAGEAPAAFDTIKVKMPGGALPVGGRLRLDFNGAVDAAEFERIASSLPRERIDFVEDPCPYDASVWSGLRKRLGLRLALDRAVAIAGVDVLVVKPAVQSVEASKLPGGMEIVVTSYMDHPVGQLHAAAVAARLATSSRCGLVTHLLYQANAFSERLEIDGARLVPPIGTGIGFDDLLEGLPWVRLR